MNIESLYFGWLKEGIQNFSAPFSAGENYGEAGEADILMFGRYPRL